MVHATLIIDYREQKIHFITSTMRIEYIEQLDPQSYSSDLFASFFNMAFSYACWNEVVADAVPPISPDGSVLT